MVVNLCAIIIVVIPFDTSSNVFYIAYSFVLSRALVASSNNKTFGFLSNALAIANLCFYPQDNYDPDYPTNVSNPFSNPITKS